MRNIYDQRRAESVELIEILGDFNDTPDNDPLWPLLKNGSDLPDIIQITSFTSDGINMARSVKVAGFLQIWSGRSCKRVVPVCDATGLPIPIQEG